MNARLRNVLLTAVVWMWSGIASAGLLHYEFSTTLALNSGPDTQGLNGATMRFTADIADGTVFAPDPTFGIQTFSPISHQWLITGSGSADGSYADPNGATFAAYIGWFGNDGAYFNFSPFNTNTLAIFQSSLDPLINTGVLVGPQHFGPFPTTSAGMEWIIWQAEDGSKYDWFSNARSTVTELNAVPTPSSLVLACLALGIVMWFSMKRRFAYRMLISHC